MVESAPMRFSKRIIVYLLVISLIAGGMVWLVTFRYGAGVSSDAARNLATVDSLLARRGFVDMNGQPFVWWPPLYPLLLAGLSWFSGWDSFNAAWYLNVFLFAFNTGLWGAFFFTVFKEKQTYAVMSSLALLTSRSLLIIAANVSSEPLFMTFMAMFAFAAGAYLETGNRQPRWWMFIAAGLATLHRHPGIAFFVVGGLLVLYKDRIRGALHALPSALLCIAPSVFWAIFHTRRYSDGFFGPRNYDTMLPLENLQVSMTKTLHFFLPYTDVLNPFLFHPWWTILGITVLLVIFNHSKETWKSWLQDITSPYMLPGLIFSMIYFVMMAFTVVTADHRDLTSDRYYVILLPVILIFIFITLDRLVLSHLDLQRFFWRYGLILLFGLWLLYPLYGLEKYLHLAWFEGEHSRYNFQNSRYFQELPAKQVVADLIADTPSAVVYSNYTLVVWFYYRPHLVSSLPYRDGRLPMDQRVESIIEHYPGWPSGKDGYMIWFTPNEYEHVATPEELSQVADLELLYQDDWAQVYRVDVR